MSYCKILIQFGLIYNAGKFKYSLHLMNYCGGILVIFQVHPIFLVRSPQNLSMTICFINLGFIYHAGKIKNSLHLTNYCEGILVIFQPLSILLVRYYQKLSVKIGLGFFYPIFELLWVFKFLCIFWEFSNI